VSALEIALAFFVVVGSKVLLGAVACWMLMPRDGECPTCNAQMLPLEAPRARSMFRVLRLQRRWCMECGTEVIGRRGGKTPPAAHQAPVVTTRWSQ
jgi:hypothetical protein